MRFLPVSPISLCHHAIGSLRLEQGSVVPHLSPSFAAYLSASLETLMNRKGLRSPRICSAIGSHLEACGLHLDPKSSRQSITILSDCIFSGLRDEHVHFYERMANKKDKSILCTAVKKAVKAYKSESKLQTCTVFWCIIEALAHSKKKVLLKSTFLKETISVAKRILIGLGMVWLSDQIVMTLGDIGSPPLISRPNRQAFVHFFDSIGALIPILMLLSLVVKPTIPLF